MNVQGKNNNDGSSPPRQSVPVFLQDESPQERQRLQEKFLAAIGLELAQKYVREAIANELAQEQDSDDSSESLN